MTDKKTDNISKELNTIDWIKENLTLLTIIPLFLGGVWQICVLSSMSLSYIRFFSVTQQISDGILVLITFWVLYYPYKIFSKNYDIDNSKLENPTKFHLNAIIFVFIFFVVYIIFLWWFPSKYTSPFAFATNEVFNIIEFFMFMMFTLVPVFLAINLFVHIKGYIIENENSWVSKFLKSKITIFILSHIFTMAFFVLCFSALVKLFVFHKTYFVPKNLINFKNLIKKTSKANPNKNIKLEYFNDKYIFIKIGDEIEIYKFDESLSK